MERIQDYVRTSTYDEAYRFLRSPSTANVPIRQKSDGAAGAGLILGSLLLAPIWFVAAPMLLAGVAANIVPPPSDERANHRNRTLLLQHLASLSARVKAELSADTAHARRISTYLKDYGVRGLEPVYSQTVFKNWDSFYSARVGSAKKRRNGWHVTDFGELHVGDLRAAFFGNQGEVIELFPGSTASVVVAQRCVVIVTYRKPKNKQVALFVPVGAFQTAVQIEAAAARIADQADSTQPQGRSFVTTTKKAIQKARALAPGPLRRGRPSDTE